MRKYVLNINLVYYVESDYSFKDLQRDLENNISDCDADDTLPYMKTETITLGIYDSHKGLREDQKFFISILKDRYKTKRLVSVKDIKSRFVLERNGISNRKNKPQWGLPFWFEFEIVTLKCNDLLDKLDYIDKKSVDPNKPRME